MQSFLFFFCAKFCSLCANFEAKMQILEPGMKNTAKHEFLQLVRNQFPSLAKFATCSQPVRNLSENEEFR